MRVSDSALSLIRDCGGITTAGSRRASKGSMGMGARLLTILLIASTALAGTPGTFRGILYPGRDTKPGWVYIVGRNDTLRLVHIANASITYADEFPPSLRVPNPAKALKPGADVRVTAEQDTKGNWRASQIEIISFSGQDERRRHGHPGATERPDVPELQTRKN